MNPTLAASGAALVAAFAIGIWAAQPPAGPATPAPAPAVVAETGLAATDRATLQAEMRRYLLEQPEIIMEVIALLENRRVADAAAAERQMLREVAGEIYEDGFSWVGGNPEGDITLVEFLDYQCGFCKRAHDEVMGMVEADGNIRLIVKEFPILGPVSDSASRAALAVLDGQGPELYKAFNDGLMRFPGRLDEAMIDRIAERAGIDVAAMRAAMEETEIERRIARNRTLAERLQITGTPTFVLGETLIRGYLPREQMEEAVRLARSAAR